MQVVDFVSALKAFSFHSVFNPYKDVCASFDRLSSPAVRCQNLFTLLNAALCAGTESIWIGRDLGYRGGRRTGLALTDELHLDIAAARFGVKNIKKATSGPTMAERTAREIWKAAIRVSPPPFFWNAFPFHPHEPANPLTNRCHTRSEFVASKDILVSLLKMLSPKHIIAVGQDAATALTGLGVVFKCVRHPSYGGQNQFFQEMQTIYRFSSMVLTTPEEPDVTGLFHRAAERSRP